MIFIGMIIIINNGNGSVETGDVTSWQVEGEKTRIRCSNEGCEWEDTYPTEGRAKQALGGHKSWCDKRPSASRYKRGFFRSIDTQVLK
jgi:hypothetical protein